MSLGVFGAVLTGVLLLMCAPRASRLRTLFAVAVAVMLGVVIAGSDGALAEPARQIVDWVRLGLTAALRLAARSVPADW